MRDECMTTEELAAWLDGRLEAADRRRLETHVAGCPACLAELVAARAEHRECFDELARRGPRRVRRIAAVAAAVVVAAAVLVALRLPALDLDRRAGERLTREIIARSDIGDLRLPGGRTAPSTPVVRRGEGTPPASAREAERRLAAAVARHPDDPSLRLLSGHLSLARGDLRMAEIAYREAARLLPGDPAVMTSLATARYRLGDDGSALDILRRASAAPGAPPETWYDLAVVAAGAGQAALAARARDAYLARDPDSPWAARLRELVP